MFGKVTNSGIIEARDYSEVQVGKIVNDPALGDYVITGGGLSNAATGVIKTSGVGAYMRLEGNVTNDGTITADRGLIVVDSGADLNNTGSVVAKNLGDFAVSGSTTNSGTMTAMGNSALEFGAMTDNSGTISITGGSRIVLFGAVTNSGTIKLDNGHTVSPIYAADFKNVGSLLLDNQSDLTLNTLNNSDLVKASNDSILDITHDVQSTGTLEADTASGIFIEGNLKNAHGELISDGGYIRVAGAANGGTALVKFQGYPSENAFHPEQLQLGGAIEFGAASNVAVTFQDTTANVLRELILDDSHDYRGQVSGFGHGDAIELGDINFSTTPGSATTFSYHDRHDGTGYLSVADADGHTAKISMIGTFSTSNFDIRSGYSTGGVMVTHHGDTFTI